MKALDWLRQFSVDRCSGGSAVMLNTPWGWFEVSWNSARDAREFMAVCRAEMTGPCCFERLLDESEKP